MICIEYSVGPDQLASSSVVPSAQHSHDFTFDVPLKSTQRDQWVCLRKSSNFSLLIIVSVFSET